MVNSLKARALVSMETRPSRLDGNLALLSQMHRACMEVLGSEGNSFPMCLLPLCSNIIALIVSSLGYNKDYTKDTTEKK